MSHTNMVLGSWRRDEWPEYVTVSHDGMREPGRRYVPERTCRVADREHGISWTQTLVTRMCSECGHEFGCEQRRDLPVPTVLDKVNVPNYCPNCGARVVDE